MEGNSSSLTAGFKLETSGLQHKTTTTCVEHSLISFNCICIQLICILYNIWFSILITRVQKAAGGMNSYYGPRPRKVSSAILPHLDFKISEIFFFSELLHRSFIHQTLDDLFFTKLLNFTSQRECSQ